MLKFSMTTGWRKAVRQGAILATVCFSLFVAQGAEAEPNTQITVPISEVRSSKGTLFVALYEQGGWLVPGRFVAYRKVRASQGTVLAKFEGIKEGKYGLAVFHDENNNGRVDTNALGLPAEGFGFSRKTPMRKPKWWEVAFDVRPSAYSPVHLRY